MIMTVDELRRYIETEETDEVLEARLSALELSIRAYTNNNFQVRPFRAVAVAQAPSSLLFNAAIPFAVGDTLQITGSDLQDNSLVTVDAVSNGEITVDETLYDESGVVITKVKYPADIKMGIVNLMKWELDRRDKVGVSSEAISRHSVTYVDQTGANTVAGYPVALMGFLTPYKRAKFGQGVRVR